MDEGGRDGSFLRGATRGLVRVYTKPGISGVFGVKDPVRGLHQTGVLEGLWYKGPCLGFTPNYGFRGPMV